MIIVFGSLSGDHVLSVDHLPHPGETKSAHAYALLPGGKGANQAVAAAKSGAEVRMCGSIGDDAAGALSRQALQSANVRCDGLRTVAGQTGTALIWVEASAENMIVVAPGTNAATCADHVSDAQLQEARHVLVQMEVPTAETWKFLAKARAAGCTTVCNLAPQQPIPDAAWKNLDVLIVNAHEAQSLVQGEPSAAALQTLARQHNLTIVMTQGAQGAIACLPDAVWRVAALPVAPVDTTGAGDAFVGALLARLDDNVPLPDALRYASVAGSLACLSTGAQSALPMQSAVLDVLDRVAAPVRVH